MRLTLAVLLVFFFGPPLAAQKTSVLNFSLLEKLNTSAKTDEDIHLYLEGNPAAVKNAIEAVGGTVKYAAGSVTAVIVPFNKISYLANLPCINRIEDNSARFEILNDKMLINNNVIPVHLGLAPLTQVYDGTGVIIGIIDYGIDFDHPDFKDELGKSRIKYLWQHTTTKEVNSPMPYKYGKEWTYVDIDKGLVPHAAEELHGTHVSGIAAGNGLAANNYKGVAPMADIIFVSLNPNDANTLSSIVDAAKYIYSKADSMGKPCVINASVGDFTGSRDAKDLPAQLINSFISQKNGRAFVCAAGNSGNVRSHLRRNLKADTSFTWFKKPSGVLNFQLWADSLNLVNVSAAIGADGQAPVYGFKGNTLFKNCSSPLDSILRDSIFMGGKRVARISRQTQYFNGRFAVNFIVYPDSSNFLFRLTTTGTGAFDLWSNDMVSDNLPAATAFPDISHYVLPDANQTIASSFTCAPNVITVGNYVNRGFYSDVNGTVWRDSTYKPGTLWITSSTGPTRDGRTKPEITAPGTIVLSTMPLSVIPFAVANVPYKVAAGGKHIRNSGTSMASPMVAGIVALYLQKNPFASFTDIKNAVLNAAKKDNFTGTALPDNRWGFGKADAFKTLSPKTTGLDPNQENVGYCTLYPNPFSEIAFMHYDFSGIQLASIQFQIVDLMGKTVKNVPLKDKEGILEIDRGNLSGGFYFYSILLDGKKMRTQKLVVQY